MSNSNVRPANDLSPQERDYENTIRPQTIADFSGQPNLNCNFEFIHIQQHNYSQEKEIPSERLELQLF